MSFWDTIKEAIRNKSQMTNWLSYTIVLLFMIYCFISKTQIDILFAKGKLGEEIYERMVKEITEKMNYAFQAVIMFIFVKHLTNNGQNGN